MTIRLKTITDEVFQDYKKPAMMIATRSCDWKCLKEENLDISLCQNSELAKQDDITVSIRSIVGRYVNNPITKAIVIAGLEPMIQIEEIIEFIKEFRMVCVDDVVIYTGYYPYEVQEEIKQLSQFENIIIKFGRYKKDSNKKFDDVLGIWLASDNQFAEKIS